MPDVLYNFADGFKASELRPHIKIVELGIEDRIGLGGKAILPYSLNYSPYKSEPF